MMAAYGLSKTRSLCLHATPARCVISSNHFSAKVEDTAATATGAPRSPTIASARRLIESASSDGNPLRPIVFLHPPALAFGDLDDSVARNIAELFDTSRAWPSDRHLIDDGRIVQAEMLP